MKRLILIVAFCMVSLAAFAAIPKLAVESVFERKDVKKPGVELVYKNQQRNYFRSISATHDPVLLEAVRKLVETDRKRAENVTEEYGEGRGSIILNIYYEKKEINIGFFFHDDGNFRLFMQTDFPELFRR